MSAIQEYLFYHKYKPREWGNVILEYWIVNLHETVPWLDEQPLHFQQQPTALPLKQITIPELVPKKMYVC
jgi:hypothetical protein